MTKKTNEEFSFEESLAKLENIVASLESGKVTLSESIGLYEEGIELSNKCTKALEDAKQRIKIIKTENYESNQLNAEEIEE